MKTILVIAVTLLVRIATAQTGQSAPPCSASEYSQFDFWVGEWDLTWEDSAGKVERGMNSVMKDYNGCVIHERFNSFLDGFRGESLTAYDPKEKEWQQTWVDSKGNYMLFTGGIKNKIMDLRMEKTNAKGQKELFSMIWTNITKDSLDWVWRKSLDGGKKWQTLWKIKYKSRLSGFSIMPPMLSPGFTPAGAAPSGTMSQPPSQPPIQGQPAGQVTPAGIISQEPPPPPPPPPSSN